MNLQFLNTIKQLGLSCCRAIVAFPNYVKAGLQPLVWLVVGAAALAGAYIALRGIWTIVQIALTALGIEGG